MAHGMRAPCAWSCLGRDLHYAGVRMGLPAPEVQCFVPAMPPAWDVQSALLDAP